MNRTPTGRILSQDGRPVLRIVRQLAAPIEDVWASLTETERMERWIGTWSGDPLSGTVLFAMTAEGEDAPAEEMEIRECDPPRVLRVTSLTAGQRWQLDVVLTSAGTGTTLTFEQPDIDPVQVESVGPGWEYYLDRLIATVEGGDITALDWERDYYPAMQAHYRSQVSDSP